MIFKVVERREEKKDILIIKKLLGNDSSLISSLIHIIQLQTDLKHMCHVTIVSSHYDSVKFSDTTLRQHVTLCRQEKFLSDKFCVCSFSHCPVNVLRTVGPRSVDRTMKNLSTLLYCRVDRDTWI